MAFIRIDIACANQTEAETIARTLVERRLAACCQLTPIRSIYRWEGAIQTDDEIRLSAKTRTTLFDQVCAAVAELHSYDVPQITAIPLTHLSADYADWLAAETDAST